MGAKNEMPEFIETRSGKHFHFLDPQPEDVDIHDIATALSLTTRWGGHTSQPVTVAEHCVRVARHLRNVGSSPMVQLQGLLHDAAEAYIGDVPSPIKRHLPDFKALEMLVEAAIFNAFDVPYPLPHIVKLADVQMFRWEYRDLMKGSVCDEPAGNPPTFVPWSPATARSEFLNLYFVLQVAIRREAA